jgi:xanthosine utilization system XapX-like protein
MTLNTLLGQILLLFGVGFLIANVRVGFELVRFIRRRHTALLVWPAPNPPFFALSLGIGVMLGLLILLKAYLALRGDPPLSEWFRRFVTDTFGELMMFIYFGYMLPFSTRITRGLYADGLWTDSGFMPYDQVGGISWRAGDPPTLVVISRLKSLARRMSVPSQRLGEVRRLLRDKISDHAIEMDEGPGIHLGSRDARDSV